MGPHLPRCFAVYETAFHKSVYVTQGFFKYGQFATRLNPSFMNIKEPDGTWRQLKEPEGTRSPKVTEEAWKSLNEPKWTQRNLKDT